MTPFCLDCRTALRGVRSCDRQHRVVDLGSIEGRSAFLREVYADAAPAPMPSSLRIYGIVIVGVLAAGFATNSFYLATGICVALAILLLRAAFKPRPRKLLGARAEPPWSLAPEKFVGTIVSAVGTRSPFEREECAGWALEVSLSGAGVMLRDGVTSGMTLELDDGRRLIIPAEMLRLARGASSDGLDSDRLAAHVAAVDELIAWDEARAIALRVGDRVEVVAGIRDGGATDYRDVRGAALTAIEVPVIRRVTTR